MRRLTFILVAALTVLALAACGGGSGDGSDGGAEDAVVSTGADSAESVLAAAATSAASAGSSNVDFTITVQVPQQEGPITLSGNGAFNYETQQGELTYDFAELFAATGQSLPGADEPIEIILDGTVLYLKWGLLSSLLPGAEEWIKVDVTDLASQEGIDLSQLQSINQGDPSQLLDYLRAVGDVEEVGTEEVRGVETTHYEGVIDLDQAVELAPEDTREQVRQSIDQLKEQTGLTELPVEVWVDADGLPARIQYSFDGSIAAAATGTDTEGFSTIFTMELYDWGTDVTIEPPPASEVTDISELAEQLGVATTG